ncbi:MAG: helix-turn-helix transcriptional regulator [Nitrospirae bacterium]|nr:helix-turn-helix transcriptional regulator [Nitrospirota bacterium]MDA1303879.1 helix-turn-helix transcriptional regulator [Nitrospirota bacterium]
MRFSGRVYKEGKWWLAEIPVLETLTQGRSRKEALEMLSDMMESMINIKGFKVEVLLGSQNEFEVGSKDIKPLIRLLLQRKRQTSGLSLSEAAARLGASSRNAYARYEQGRSVPTIEKLDELLRAVSPNVDIVIQKSVLA